MTSSPRPSDHVYVVKLSASAEPSTLRGRIEHVGSGRRHEFHDATSLLDCLVNEEAAAALAAAASVEPGVRDGDAR